MSWHYSLVGRLCHQVPGSVPVLSPLSCDLEFWPRYCVWHCALRSLPHRLSALGQAVTWRSFKRSSLGSVAIYDLQGLSYGRNELVVAGMRHLVPDPSEWHLKARRRLQSRSGGGSPLIRPPNRPNSPRGACPGWFGPWLGPERPRGRSWPRKRGHSTGGGGLPGCLRDWLGVVPPS